MQPAVDRFRLHDPGQLSSLLAPAKQALSQPAGIISTGGPYPVNADCAWTIRPPDAGRVTLEFTTFNLTKTQYASDVLLIYDGASPSPSALLANFTGSRLPPSVTTTGGSLTIVLKTDLRHANARRSAGFEATYRADNAPEGFVATADEAGNTCTAAQQPVSLSCSLCVLRTLASVCGDDCAKESLHVVLDANSLPTVPPAVCHPGLAQRIRTMQGAAVTLAVGQRHPFGLSGVGQLTDLYVPTAEAPLFGEPVYKGMDTGVYMFSCNPSAVPQLWALSTSQERAAWQRCEGSLHVDLRKGEARSALLSSPEAEAVPMVVHELGVCSIPFTGAAPAVSADSQTVVLTKSSPSTDVACWLTRFRHTEPNRTRAETGSRLDDRSDHRPDRP